MQQLSSPASVFCVSASSDADLLARWERHLKPLVQAKHITLWSEGHLLAGTPRIQQIHDHLDHADLIVLLVSAAFFADDACVALMERAIERVKDGKARLIPLLLRPVAWRESSLASFPCVPSNNRPVMQWSNRDAAFNDCVRDIRRLLGRPITAPLTHRHTRTEASQNQNRTRMLKRVQAIWIDGLLTQSLQDAVRIELHLQDRPDVLNNPLRLQVQELDQAPKALPDGTTIVQVYDEAEGELLILGEPGSGKTTLLLELAAALLERAGQDEQIPIPVIFNLSSWAEKRRPLRVWLLEELWRIYQVPRKIGKAWIDADHILPLLDGLDEVAKDARSACVEQINDYYQSRLERGSSPIVVCCRSEEYASLSTRVMLRHAVSILPLTDAQITTFLERAGEQVKELRQALEEDAELHSLARQPLMLNIFTLAYQGARASDVPTGETSEGVQHTIFARYVERMLKRRGQSKRWEPMQVIQWLTFLAREMQQQNQSLFSVENLQPTWLTKKWKARYRWCVALTVALIMGPLLKLEFEQVLSPITRPLWGPILGPFLELILSPVWRLIGSIFFSLLFGLALGFSEIRPAEALVWSWEKAWRIVVASLVAGLVSGLLMPLNMITLVLLLLTLASLGLFLGFSGKQLAERKNLSSNAGIWRSGRNGLIIWLVIGLIYGPLSGLITYGFLTAQGLGLVTGLLTGLAAFLQHFLLRTFLSQQGKLPWKLIPFLDEAAERLLLRKVGGSYLFVHRRLLDYFASLDEPEAGSVE